MNKVEKRRKNTSIRNVKKKSNIVEKILMRIFNNNNEDVQKIIKQITADASEITDKALLGNRGQLLERVIEGIILLIGGLVEGDLSMRRPRSGSSFIPIASIRRPERPDHFVKYTPGEPLGVYVNDILISIPTHFQIKIHVAGMIDDAKNTKFDKWTATPWTLSYIKLMCSCRLCLETKGKRDRIVELLFPFDPKSPIIGLSDKTTCFGCPTLIRGKKST